MKETIRLSDVELITKYAIIYASVNDRPDVVIRCNKHRMQMKQYKEEALLTEEEVLEFSHFCKYAVVSAYGADFGTQDKICRIIAKYASHLDQYDCTMIKTLAKMQRDKELGKKCPFYKLCRFFAK